MKATVLTRQGDPVIVSQTKTERWEPRDLDIAPEYMLKLTMWGLQSIMRSSRCHASRMTARSVLEAIGKSGEVPVDGQGMPMPVAFPGNLEDRTYVWVL
jgi:hypothetical protein